MTYRPFEQERQWRHRAEELRTIGESCASEAVRDSYFQLAEDYERLADRAATAACGKADHIALGNEKPPTSLYRLARRTPPALH
jgi:hypothetical protein